MSTKVSPANNEPASGDAKLFEVNIYTLARKLNPKAAKLPWPLTLKIKLNDTPRSINNRFKQKYGYHLDTLMLAPDNWKDGGSGYEPKLDEQSRCEFCRKSPWILKNVNKTIKVRMRV